MPEKQEKAAPEVRKVPRTSSTQAAKPEGQAGQTAKKVAPTNNATAGAQNTSAKPKQNPGTTETKPTV